MVSKNVTLKEAEGHLAELVERVGRGEEVILIKDDQPCAKLVSLIPPLQQPRQFGQHAGKAWMAEDFNAPLAEEFWLDLHGS